MNLEAVYGFLADEDVDAEQLRREVMFLAQSYQAMLIALQTSADEELQGIVRHVIAGIAEDNELEVG